MRKWKLTALTNFLRTTLPSIGVFLGLMLMNPPEGFGEAGREIPEPVSKNPATLERIIPADVLARVELVREETKMIRVEMGKPKDSRKTHLATDAQPHEVYFQSLTLFLKADRLALELTGSTGLPPRIITPSGIRPFHVWTMVNAAYARILTVKEELGIFETVSEQPKDLSTSPTEVVRAIVNTNRQLNLLLERRFSSSDVYQQVDLAIRYAAVLLDQFPGVNKNPAPPLFIRGKQPGEVFRRLVQCYEHLERIADRSNLKVLDLDAEAADQAVKALSVFPSDVYDLATLLVSDLAYLHTQIKDAAPPGLAPHPGRKFPSHSFQKAGILLDQLVALEKLVEKHPRWLDFQ